MKAYLKNFLQQTPQSQPIPNTNQVPNSAGGYSWELDMWGRLQRFLILGSEGGTYYINQHQLTVENANNVMSAIQADGLRAVNEIVTLSNEGRAPKNDPAIFALALAASMGYLANNASSPFHVFCNLWKACVPIPILYPQYRNQSVVQVDRKGI